MIKSIKNTIKPLLLFCAFVVFLGTPWHAFANPASPVIQEIYYDAEGPDEGKEFIELYGLSGTDLGGFSLIGINGSDGQIYYTVDLSGYTLPQNGLLVIAGSYVNVPSEVLTIPLTTSLQNGPDAVQLWQGEVRSGGTIIDALAYGGADIYGEGTAALAAPAGKSLSRLAGIDTGNNFTDFYVTNPTPGTVPIPGAVWLLGSGIACLFGLRKKMKSTKKILAGVICVLGIFFGVSNALATIVTFEDFELGSYGNYSYQGYIFSALEVVNLSGNKVAVINSFSGIEGQGIAIGRSDGQFFNAGNVSVESFDASNNPAATGVTIQFFYDGEIPANAIDDDFDGEYEEPNGHTGFSTDSISGFQTFSANSSYSDYQYLAFYKNSDYPQIYVDNIELPTVPIPGALWLLGSGLLGLVVSRRKVIK